MSEAVTVQLILGLFAILQTSLTIVLTFLLKRSTRSASAHALALSRALENSTQDTEERLGVIEDIQVATHDLLDARLDIDPKIYLEVAKRLAQITEDPRDALIASHAAAAYSEYRMRARATSDTINARRSQIRLPAP